MSRRIRPGRREHRDELQSTWSVYDASRPIRRSDFDANAERDELVASKASASVIAPVAPAIVLPRPEDVSSMSDADIAALMGITEMDVREARKWAREQAERLGDATFATSGEKH